ncbi:MAG: hypothetical protein JOY81_11065 [Alphaproteobacteria bacterium]|nr:hypothetical protein [Alphaproteobacteria bacterium]
MLKALPFALVLSLVAVDAFADCSCRCVNGQSQPVCSSTLDIRPICSQQNCPVTPSMEPVQPLDHSVGGTAMCDSIEVFNRRTGRWETRPVCR